MNTNKSVTWELTNNVFNIWLDSPNRGVNVLDEDMIAGLEAAVEQVNNNPACQAVVFRSRKPGCFIAGADVTVIASLNDADEVRAIVKRGQNLMKSVADLNVVSLAAIDGSCLGGGLELALACTFRVASDSPKTKLGAPEIRLGLIPAWGGTQRLPHAVGLGESLKLTLKGSSIPSVKANKIGLVDQVVSSDQFDQAIDRFVEDVSQLPTSTAMPTNKNTNVSKASVFRRGLNPGKNRKHWKNRLLDNSAWGRWLTLHFSRRKVSSRMTHYPALEKAIKAISMAFDRKNDGYQYECDSFSELLFTPTAQSLVGLFIQRDMAKKPSTWLRIFEHIEVAPIEKMAVIGAGTMGAGIGGVAAIKGIEVLFKEINEPALQAGSERVDKILRDQLRQHQITQVENTEAAKRISFTTDWTDLTECDLAIEAVLEIEDVKRVVFQMMDQSLPKHATLVSNTSSLSVTQMAHVTGRRQKVAGLHFFNPVERMELVEVVRTEATDDDTMAKLLKLVRRLGKTPVVTADQPGFLVNRILFPYLGEAIRMVTEGTRIERIDRELKRFGMPMGPLELIDQVGVDIAANVANSLSKIHPETDLPTSFLVNMAEKKWLGKKTGIGFYRWDRGRRSKKKRQPNAALARSSGMKSATSNLTHEDTSNHDDSFDNDGMSDTQRRLLYPMLNEAVHCLDQRVVSAPWMVDLGMVLGTGFAPMFGGPLGLVDLLGVDVVYHNMQILERRWGNRFSPAKGLVAQAAAKEPFFPPENESERIVARVLRSRGESPPHMRRRAHSTNHEEKP